VHQGEEVMKATVIIATIMLAVCGGVLAIPTLQLDIEGGVYDPVTETTIAGADVFDLYALLSPDADSTLEGLYRFSAALTPQTAQTVPGPDLGSILVGGVSYDVTGDMEWGTPPLPLLLGTTEEGKDLPPHSIFPTYYLEFEVDFTRATTLTLSSYNVQDDIGDPADFPFDLSNPVMYGLSFAVDVSGLAEGYDVQFDLYQVLVNSKKEKTDIVQFAPFSHDAATTGVPDSGVTIALLGLALVGLAGLQRRVLKG
jgi:hypothetical protein